MKVGILGTGIVGTGIGDALIALGHEVIMGGREQINGKGQAWASQYPQSASYGTFAEAAAFGEIIINATRGSVSLEALEMAGEEQLAGKTLIDLANELDFSTERPIIHASDAHCLGERIQQRFPTTNVVKSLNTINWKVMVQPALIPGDHVVFMSGDSTDAKAQTRALLHGFGWQDTQIYDLGGIATARGPEMFLSLWVSLLGIVGSSPFNIAVLKGA